MTSEDTDVLADVIVQAVKAVTAPLERRIAELESRATAVPYKGVWKTETPYHRGDFVTDAGSMWFCRALTYAKPGTDDTWQLAIKRGRDGKDLR